MNNLDVDATSSPFDEAYLSTVGLALDSSYYLFCSGQFYSYIDRAECFLGEAVKMKTNRCVVENLTIKLAFSTHSTHSIVNKVFTGIYYKTSLKVDFQQMEEPKEW